MEEKQKIWIRGVKDRGEEVINTLENLGGNNQHGYTGVHDARVYFISHKGYIAIMNAESECAHIIMDNYKEIKLPDPQWKDGDILSATDTKEYVVYCDEKTKFDDEFFTYVSVSNTDGLCRDDDTLLTKYFRLATKTEINEFHKMLHEYGKDWDAEKKDLVDWPWKPKVGELYYYITKTGNVATGRGAEGNMILDDMFLLGNCFKTKAEAEAMAKKFRELLKGGKE